MNVFELPANGGGYAFGSPWGIPDLKSEIDVTSNTISLYPNFNTYADNSTDAFWVNQTTLEGNKQMEASTFVEPGATFNENDLTFSGNVITNTIDAGYEVKYFIKALDPNSGFSDALGGSQVFDLPSSGAFSVTVPAANLPAGLIIQYGFTVIGVNANPNQEAALGKVVLGPACSIDASTSVTNITIEANAAGMSYQWINCEDNSPIMNATNQSFTASENGAYAVIVSDGACSDTSDCVTISTVGIANEIFNHLKVSPNPTRDILSIESDYAIASVKLIDLSGKVVYDHNFNSNEIQLSLESLPAGFYQLNILSENQFRTYKIVKE
jgi:hypothetical protein